MTYMKSRLQFWLLLILTLNVLGLVSMYARGILEQADAPSALQLILGFLLQLPLVLLCVFIDNTLTVLSSKLPLSLVLRFLSRFIFLYLFLLFYIASTLIYLGVGVFVSFEVIKIAVLDFDQIMPILLTTALWPVLFVALLDVLLILPMRKILPLKCSKLRSLIFPIFTVWLFLFFCGALFSMHQLNKDQKFSVAVLKNTFPPTYLLGEVFEYLGRSNAPIPELNVDQLQSQITMAEYRVSAGEMSTRPPVILIMLESISHDHLGFTGYEKSDITPSLDALFQQSVFFDRAYTPSNHSNLAQGSILSSQYSLRRIRLESFKDINFVKPMLFDVLHEYGYETALYSSQDENWLGMRRFIESNDAKIDHFKHALDFTGYYKFYDRKIDDADLITEIEKYLKEVRNPDQPQMLYINLQRTHYDYRLKPGVSGYYGDIDSKITGMFFDYGEHQAEKAKLQYDNALHYVDKQLGRLFTVLKELEMYDDALIIVTADHGEAFYENGYATHGTSMYDAQIRSFLSVKLPGQVDGEYRKDAISSVDMLPMALQALGLPNHPAFQGYQLLDVERTQAQPIFSTAQSVVRAEAVIQYPWKYFVSEKEGAVLINLADDPAERNNLLLVEGEVTQRLQLWRQQYRHDQLQYYRSSDQSISDDFYVPKYDFKKLALDD